jgi:hypothetical protein
MVLFYEPRPRANINLFILSKGFIRWISLISLAFCLSAAYPLFVFPTISFSAEITVAWTPAKDPEVAGYKVYYGPPDQDNKFQADAGKETKITLKDLQGGGTYSFIVSTYDRTGRESSYSHKTAVINLRDKGTHFISVAPSRIPSTSVQEKPFPEIPPGCQFDILPASQFIGYSGGTGTVRVSTALNCPWTAVANVPWGIITSNSSGMGSKVVYYLVKANPDASPREGTLALAYQKFKVFQAGRIRYALNLTRIGSGEGTIFSVPPGAAFEAGTVVTLKATPAANSTFDFWSGQCSGAKPVCSLTIGSSSSVVKAAFRLKTFVITASAGANGSIAPAGRVLANYGASQKFTFKANKGYKIGQIRVDGVSVGNPESLLFGNIMNSHKIDAIFISIPKENERKL